MARMKEGTLNAYLAQELDAMLPGWTLTPESTRALTNGGQTPDIIVETEIAPLSIETEYAPALTLEEDALARVGATFASSAQVIESAVAVRLPIRLSEIPAPDIFPALRSADDFEWCVWIEGPASVRFPSLGFIKGSLADLATFIETVAVSERRITGLADTFEEGVSQSATRLRASLQSASSQSTLEKIARALHLRDGAQTTVIAVAIVANALVFQEAVSGAHDTPRIEELRSEHGTISVSKVLETWRKILDINYWPIFAVATEVLKPVGEKDGQILLEQLTQVVTELAKGGVLAAGDLAGQMFGRLIADRKFLATFYTLPASATLLAELATKRLDERHDWADAGALSKLRIADFACGTGMLLSAAYRRIASRVKRTGRLEDVDQTRLMHAAFMEEILVGCDIMPAATHLTASILSAAYPSSPFVHTNIHLMPYGYSENGKVMGASIGSLELLGDEMVRSLLGTGRARAGGLGDLVDDDNSRRDLRGFAIDDSSIDLVIQNPPFTRPNGPEANKLGVPIPSFAGFDTSEDEQKAMSVRLKALTPSGIKRGGHGNAGLASNFIDLAHAKLRSGGVLALVLPATFASGEAWGAARNLLATQYEDISIVSLSSASKYGRAFSADTGMAEVLVVANRKAANPGGEMNGGEVNGVDVNSANVNGFGVNASEVSDVANGDGTIDGEVIDEANCGEVSGGVVDGGKASVGEVNGLAQVGESSVWVNWISLNKRPENPVEAVNAANAIAATQSELKVKAGNGRPYSFLVVGEEQIGCQLFAPLSEGGCALISEPMVASAASGLRCGRLHLPRIGTVALPTLRLGALGRAGPQNRVFDDKRIRTDKNGKPQLDERGRVIRNGIFDISRPIGDPKACEYPTLWGHDVASGRESQLVVEPDRDLRPWPGHEQRARDLWPTATRLHYNRDFGLRSQALSACLTPQKAFGGRAWPSFILDQREFEAALVLWANTTIGLIGHWWVGTRQQEGRTLLSIRTLPDLPTLDCRQLSAAQVMCLDEIFERFANRPLLRASEAYKDKTRQELDEAVFCDALELHKGASTSREDFLEALSLLRRQWCSEPSVHGGKQPTL